MDKESMSYGERRNADHHFALSGGKDPSRHEDDDNTGLSIENGAPIVPATYSTLDGTEITEDGSDRRH